MALTLLTFVANGLACRARGAPDPADSSTTAHETESRKLPNRIAYIPPACFTKTTGENGRTRNPCYVCHVHGDPPNFVDDASFQLTWSFPLAAKDNPWTNLFSPPVLRAAPVSDEEILAYVRRSNYFDAGGGLALAGRLQHVPREWDENQDGKWGGYIPDAWLHFDDHGFDVAPDGARTGWRAFAYYPVPGTFFPTNGSMDDVLIRLDPILRQNERGQDDPAIYALNLAIVEALIRRVDVPIDPVDEKPLGVDLDLDGAIGRATRVAFDAGDGEGTTRMRYVGRARDQGRAFPIAPGLFPLRTEFLHSLRYLDVGPGGTVTMAPRMKELRYAKKVRWFTYTMLRAKITAEAIEQNDARDGTLQVFSEFERGVSNGQGWMYQGFIEERDGSLRPQTFEESVFCTGCHGGVGATVDGVFAFPRKLDARAWFHASQRDLRGVPEPRRRDGSYEYTRYLEENGAGDDLRENAEVVARFFGADGAPNQAEIAALHQDVSRLLLPSAPRAIALDRAYRAIVTEQGFVHGRDALLAPSKNVYLHPPIGEPTGVKEPLAPR